ALLRPRQVRQPARRGGVVADAAPARHPARAAPRHDRGEPAGDADGRAGGDGGHVPPAEPDAPGCADGRPGVPVQLAGVKTELTTESQRTQRKTQAERRAIALVLSACVFSVSSVTLWLALLSDAQAARRLRLLDLAADAAAEHVQVLVDLLQEHAGLLFLA